MTLVALALGLAGCENVGVPVDLGRNDKAFPNAPYGTTVIPNLPQVQDPGVRYTKAQVRAEVFKLTGVWADMDDAVFAPVPVEYVRGNRNLIIAHLQARLPQVHVPESGDCDDAARILREVAADLFRQAGIEAVPLVPVVETGQRYEFARVAGSERGRHALTGITVLVQTPDGPRLEHFILESQSPRAGDLTFAPLEEYPNFEFIDAVSF